MVNQQDIPLITADIRWTPPEWAYKQRKIIEILNNAAVEYVEKYTRKDGTLIWRDEWPGMDGSDDPYEGFMNLSLFYVLGGSEDVLKLSQNMWDTITWQWTQYGQIYDEFDAYYDWMHHGEGYLFLYFLGLADSNSLKGKQRAIKFANFYTGENPDVKNYDEKYKLIRSPINGSCGPRFTTSEEDWETHREVLDNYLAPFEDLPGVEFKSWKCPWTNDETYKDIIQMINQRMTKGDVPLNLNSTSLVTHAFMYSGHEAYKHWIIEYLEAWMERSRINGGVIPDNIGLTGKIGEFNDGKWWGGYYGWRWPHGFMTIIEPILNACMNAVLLTGDLSYLQLIRSQLDEQWKRRKKENGKWVVPYRHFDNGWTDYRPANPIYPIYCWLVSMEEEDLNRINRLDIEDFWNYIDIPVTSGRDPKTGKETKHFIGNTFPWFRFICGENTNYPEQILDANYQLIIRQIEKMRSREWDPRFWNFHATDSIHWWQEVNPVYVEGLLQTTLGAPMHISHGGLQYGQVRYYDTANKRPGLPESVSALVEEVKSNTITVHLINTDQYEDREVIIQAGTFCEHVFRRADILNRENVVINFMEMDGKWININLRKKCGIRLTLIVDRYVNEPSYQTPWSEKSISRIKNRKK